MKSCHYILAILVLLVGFNVEIMNSAYIGCFLITSTVSLASEFGYEDSNSNTVEMCGGFCQEKNLRYSLLAYG